MPTKTTEGSSQPAPDTQEAPVANEVAIDPRHQDEPPSSATPADSRTSKKLHAMELQAAAIRENQLTLNARPQLNDDFERRMNALELQLAAVNANQRTLITAQLATGADASEANRLPGHEVDDPCPCKKRKPSCCVELFISGLQFLENNDGNAELIIGVQANGTWGILPSLTSYVLLDKGVTAIIPFHTVISRICIECDACKEIPLKVNALEVAGGGGEGRPESGEADSSITVSCACPEAKTFLAVPFAKHSSGGKVGRVRGIVGVEISARAYPGGCC